MTDDLVVPPPGTLGVWIDARPLEDYPDELRPRRGPPPRAVVAFQGVVASWLALGARSDKTTCMNLRLARKQILAFRTRAEALCVRRAKAKAQQEQGALAVEALADDYFAGKSKPARKLRPARTRTVKAPPAPPVAPPAPEVAPPPPAAPSQPPPATPPPAAASLDVPQDDFMAALAAVFG